MAWIPGGEFSMGANDPPDMDDVGMKATHDARPIHRVRVDGFFMDKTVVTNAQFDAASEDRIVRDYRARLGQGVEVRITHVADIPPEKSGKFRYVVSKVAPDHNKEVPAHA